MFNFEQRVYILSAKFNHIMTVIFFGCPFLSTSLVIYHLKIGIQITRVAT